MKTVAKKKVPSQPSKVANTAADKARRVTTSKATFAKVEDCVVAPSVSNVLGYLLRRSHNAFQSYWMTTFYSPELPITSVQAGMMVAIGDTPGMTQTELARIMNVEGPTLMQSIDRLQKNGFLTREPRVADRRSNSLHLSAEGVKMLANINGFLPRRDAVLLSDLSPREITQLLKLLTKIVVRAHAVSAHAATSAVRTGKARSRP